MYIDMYIYTCIYIYVCMHKWSKSGKVQVWCKWSVALSCLLELVIFR